MRPIGVERAALQYRPDLDGIRAISCLLVFFAHILGSKSWHGLFPWLDLLEGWIGVYIFFVLSGFLITSLLLGEEKRRGGIHFGRFLVRREFRIVPAYYITIAFYALLCLTPLAHQFSSQFRAGFWYWVLYAGDIATNVPAVGTLFGHSWSLAVEQRFYLIYPFLLFGIWRAWQARLTVFVLTVLAVRFLPVGNVNAYFALLLGSAAAFFYVSGRAAQLLGRIPMIVTVAPVVAWIAVLHWQPRKITTFSFLVAILLVHLSVKESLFKRALTFPPLVWLGQRSYSFYLVHVIFLNLSQRLIDNTTAFGATLCIAVGILASIGAACVSYAFIEEPFRRMGKRLAEGRPPASVAFTAPVTPGVADAA